MTTRKYTVETTDSTHTVYGDTIGIGGGVLEINRDGRLAAMFRDWRSVTADDDQVSRVIDALTTPKPGDLIGFDRDGKPQFYDGDPA